MARSTMQEQTVVLGNILGTESSAKNHPIWYNDRADGASIRISGLRLLGEVTADASNYYTLTFKDDSGDTMGSTHFATNAITNGATTPTTISLTAANCLLADNEGFYVTFAQTGNGQTINGLTAQFTYTVERAG